MSENKQKRLRFTYQDDVAFLKEFLAYNPIGNLNNWNIIQNHLEQILKKRFLIKTLKNHLQLLLETWLKDENRIKSGVEVTYCERDALLQKIHTLCGERSFFLIKQKKISKESQICTLGSEARNTWVVRPFLQHHESDVVEEEVSEMDHDYVIENKDVLLEPISSTSKPEESIESPETDETFNISKPNRCQSTDIKSVRYGTLNYLSDRHKNDLSLKTRELELEEAKLKLEEKKHLLDEKKHELEREKVEFDHRERMQRLDMEKKAFDVKVQEREALHHLLDAQKDFINKLLNK